MTDERKPLVTLAYETSDPMAERLATLDRQAEALCRLIAETEAGRIDTIETGRLLLKNDHASNRSSMAALQTQNADALASAEVSLQANGDKLGADLAGIAASTGTKFFMAQSQTEIAKNYVPEIVRKQRAVPWATGTKGIGDM